MAAENASEARPVARTTEGLRTALFDELNLIRRGASTVGKANSTAKLVNGVVETIRIELDFHRHMSRVGEKEMDTATSLGKPIRLISDEDTDKDE